MNYDYDKESKPSRTKKLFKELCEKGFDAPPWFKRIFFYYFPILLLVQWAAVFFSVKRYSLEQSTNVVIILWYAWVGGIAFASLVYGALLHLLYLDRKYKFLPRKPPATR